MGRSKLGLIYQEVCCSNILSGIIKDIKVDPRNRDLCNKEKKATTRSSPIGYWSKGSIIGWYFGIGQGSC